MDTAMAMVTAMAMAMVFMEMPIIKMDAFRDGKRLSSLLNDFKDTF